MNPWRCCLWHFPHTPANLCLPRCLFVLNLPPDTDEGALWALFGPFGPIQSIKVVREGGATGKCKGFAFVSMLNYDDCLRAIAGLDGCQIDSSHVIRVTFKKFQLSAHQGISQRCGEVVGIQQPAPIGFLQEQLCYAAAPTAAQVGIQLTPQGLHAMSGLSGSLAMAGNTLTMPAYMSLPPNCYTNFTDSRSPIAGYAIL